MQILDEDPDIYFAANRLIEAADWVIWQLTGVETRNLTAAGYKGMWSKREGFLPKEFFKALDPAWRISSRRSCRSTSGNWARRRAG